MNAFRSATLPAWLPLAVVLAAAPLLARSAAPWQLLLWATIVTYLAIEIAAVRLGHSAARPGDSRLGRVLWWTVWPGISSAYFRTRRSPDLQAGALLSAGGIRTACGLLACAAVAVAARAGASDAVVGWAGIWALLLTVHLGATDVLTALLRRLGFAVPRPFRDPLVSRSLREFWSTRWNTPFAEMNRLLLTSPLRRRYGPGTAVLVAFAVSGLLHEMSISYTVGAGWGGPAAYFLLHGCLVLAETQLRMADWPAWRARLWTWTWLLVPLPLLFHPTFRSELVVPVFRPLF